MKIIYHSKNHILNILLSKSRQMLFKMISLNKQLPLILDIGCAEGTFTAILSQIHETIGLDIDKNKLRYAKHCHPSIDLICADIHHLPLKGDSLDLIICSSVLEYISNLETGIKEIKRILRKCGTLVVGYPINTIFIKALMGIFGKRAIRTWNPLKVLEYNEYIKDFDTQKQSYQSIRSILAKHFNVMEKKKMPFSYSPDVFSFYECVRLTK